MSRVPVAAARSTRSAAAQVKCEKDQDQPLLASSYSFQDDIFWALVNAPPRSCRSFMQRPPDYKDEEKLLAALDSLASDH